MKTSESIIEISKALFKFQKDVGSVSKDGKNPHFNSKFATLSNILNSIHSDLDECGLVITQAPGGDGDSVTLTTTLIHVESGEYMTSTFSMNPVKRDPQAFCSCITYMRRYAITSILCLNVDDDDDGNAASIAKNKQDKIRFSSECTKLLSKFDEANSLDELGDLIDRVKNSEFTEDEKSALRIKASHAKRRLNNGVLQGR